jgi:hypothetical protein
VAAVSLVPRFLQQFADQFLQLVELLSVQSDIRSNRNGLS